MIEGFDEIVLAWEKHELFYKELYEKKEGESGRIPQISVTAECGGSAGGRTLWFRICMTLLRFTGNDTDL